MIHIRNTLYIYIYQHSRQVADIYTYMYNVCFLCIHYTFSQVTHIIHIRNTLYIYDIHYTYTEYIIHLHSNIHCNIHYTIHYAYTKDTCLIWCVCSVYVHCMACMSRCDESRICTLYGVYVLYMYNVCNVCICTAYAMYVMYVTLDAT